MEGQFIQPAHHMVQEGLKRVCASCNITVDVQIERTPTPQVLGAV